MSKIDQNLSEIFEFECNTEKIEDLPSTTSNTEIVVTGELVQNTVEDDFNIARNNINNLIEKGNVAITDLLNVAKESEHPRAYEVAANFLKTLADLNKDLLEIQKKKREMSPDSGSNAQGKNLSIDKAVFIGSTEQLIDLIKEKK